MKYKKDIQNMHDPVSGLPNLFLDHALKVSKMLSGVSGRLLASVDLWLRGTHTSECLWAHLLAKASLAFTAPSVTNFMETSVCCLNPTQAVALQSWLFNISWIQTFLWNSYSSKCLCEHPFCLSPSPFFVVGWRHLEVRLLSQRSFMQARAECLVLRRSQ